MTENNMPQPEYEKPPAIPPIPEKEVDFSKYENLLKTEAPKERWKRDNDRKLFQYLREHCRDNNDTIESIKERLEKDPDAELPFWSKVAHQLLWRGPVVTLQK